MKKGLLKFGFLIFGASALLLSSCEKDNDGEENEEEVITTMQLTFVPTGAGTTVTYKFDDPDGPGGANATIDEIVLAPGATYNVTVQLLNKTENPEADITAEVAAESQDHRFYYEVTGSPDVTVSGLNTDINGLPLGITSIWTTGAASTGKVEITLRHYANGNKAADDLVTSTKSASDISSSEAGGFVIKIQ